MALMTRWDEAFTAHESLEILVDLALSHCQQAGAVADVLAGFLHRRDYAAVCEWKVDYDAGLTPIELLHIRQALAFFTKLEDLDIGVNKDEVARRKFYESELACLRTNDIFDAWGRGDFQFRPRVEQVLYLAQRKIASVLGAVPRLENLKLAFGPGGTTSVPKRKACARTKLSAVPSCTHNMLPLVSRLLAEMPGYTGLHTTHAELRSSVERQWDAFDELFDLPTGDPDYQVRELNETNEERDDRYARIRYLVDEIYANECEIGREEATVELHHGKISFVAKNAKTSRTVMTEPTLNAMMQAGLGDVMAKRLRSVGQDIKDQARNQRLAREGSLTGALATLDLSSASDSISIELVAHLVPYDWLAAMMLCRTPTIQDAGKIVRLHKFSSMGNGFTFPLQTLIFWSLASSCAEVVRDPETRVNVYGDDIIVGIATVPLLREVLQATGFTLNSEKSYWAGGFRESCGKDYYFGYDIRPCYVKTWLTGASLFVLHNWYYNTMQYEMADVVKGLIPPEIALYGPAGYGDGHLHSDDWVRKQFRRERGYGGYIFDTYVFCGKTHKVMLPGDRVLPCYTVYVREDAPEGTALQTPHVKNKRGEWLHPELTVPGVEGYERKSIYTLTG